MTLAVGLVADADDHLVIVGEAHIGRIRAAATLLDVVAEADAPQLAALGRARRSSKLSTGTGLLPSASGTHRVVDVAERGVVGHLVGLDEFRRRISSLAMPISAAQTSITRSMM